MARRSDHKRDELYALAMKAAKNIVERDGYRALTARNVADAIGYSPGTLYNLFANLDDMIVHLNGTTLDGLYDALVTMEMTGDVIHDLKTLTGHYLDYVEANARLWSLLMDYTLPDGDVLPDWYFLKVDKLLSLPESALAPLFLTQDDLRRAEAARVLWAGMHGILSLSSSGKLAIVSRDPVQRMADNLIETYIRGLQG